jgi:RNase P subunit RPR2
MKEREGNNGLMERYVRMLECVSERKEIVLPNSLKRDCLDRALDEENFEKLSKKIKID